MIKYYYNEKTDMLCIDTNLYTPYLAGNGYIEVTKEFYDEKSKEQEERYRLEHPEEFGEGE